MAEKKRGRGMFAATASKAAAKSKAGPVVSSEEYEDGEKPFAQKDSPSPSKAIGGSASPIARKPVGGVKTAGSDKYEEVPAKLIRSWSLKDRTLSELDDDPEYANLVRSVRAQGVIEPIIVRKLGSADKDGHLYEEIAGFKRLNAAKSVGINIPVIIHDLDDQAALRIQANENVGRSMPSAWSRALHYRALVESNVFETHGQLADSLDLNKSTLSNLLRVASGIPEDLVKSLKLHLVGSTSLIHLLSRINSVTGNDRERLIDRLVEFADEFNEKPEKAIRTIDKAWASLFERKTESTAKPMVYQSQKGKTLSVKVSGDSMAVTLHQAALEVATHDELTQLVTDYLESKGLSLEEQRSKKR